MMIRSPFAAVMLAVILAACRSDKTSQNATGSAAARTGQAAPREGGMPGMQGMGRMQGSDMMAQMQTHLRMMNGVSADSLEAMLPVHRQMVANMLAQMNSQMRTMHMATDAQWTALVDSLRQDLVHMPELSPTELEGFMPAHRARVTRLMAMHRSMMGTMQN